MQRFIPQDAQEQTVTEAKLVIYRYLSNQGPALVAYKGRQRKPINHIACATEEALQERIDTLVKEETRREDYKRERQQATHGLQENDILYVSWGCEQTNVHFYQVVRVPSGRSAVVREIESEKTIDGPETMTGTAMPRIGDFVKGSVEFTRRAVGEGCLKGESRYHGELAKWDGTPRRFSSYG